MASIISSPAFPCSSSTISASSTNRSGVPVLSLSAITRHKAPKLSLSAWVSSLVLRRFSPWTGLKHLGISVERKSLAIQRSRSSKGKGIYASLFGVGAPEALVIGVVALLVFGPKGLAEVARNLGKTLREFQPTIKELQQVSREFKSSLEREIGLDEISSSMNNTYRSNPTSSPSSAARAEDSRPLSDPMKVEDESPSNRAYTSEEYLKITQDQLQSAASQQQLQSTLPEENQTQTKPPGISEEAAISTPPNKKTESET